jgi:hypothetical protein
LALDSVDEPRSPRFDVSIAEIKIDDVPKKGRDWRVVEKNRNDNRALRVG